ncbi:hypothetical protein BJ138DRAFT_1102602 [Hygrophoropsis aurantiaca]|uniref:Uncharacterized protein n=1 Tax=Hygrophoropsis aurantiaca TaxID=72124 RepID=A0ACB8A8Z4_9AGAM|nr:hypothetical protein BJ138DRAFT_1102602 [Hygrophoropsis aurantiaca]
MCRWLSHNGYYFEQRASSEETLDSIIHRISITHDVAMLPFTAPQVRQRILVVLNFCAQANSDLKVQLIVVSGSPIRQILNFHSRSNWVKKWRDRGIEMVSDIPQSTQIRPRIWSGSRSTADSMCWIIPLESIDVSNSYAMNTRTWRTVHFDVFNKRSRITEEGAYAKITDPLIWRISSSELFLRGTIDWTYGTPTPGLLNEMPWEDVL